METIPNKMLRQLSLVLLIAGLSAVLFWQLKFFLPATLGAYTLYVLLRRPLFYLTDVRRWKKELAAAALLGASIVVLILPAQYIFQVFVSRILPALQHAPEWLQQIQSALQQLEIQYKVSILTPDTLQKIADFAAKEVSVIVSASVSGFVTFIVMYFLLWFMLRDGHKMEQTLAEWIPLRTENESYFQQKINEMVISNALGIPLMGIVQGIFGWVAYWIAGVQEPGLWFIITMLAGMLPIFGVALAYIPLALIELANGHPGIAAFIFLYGFIVLGSVDNIARMWVLKKIGNAHPLITLFGVIAGLQLFGFIGFVFGPIMLSTVLLLLHLYTREFSQ